MLTVCFLFVICMYYTSILVEEDSTVNVSTQDAEVLKIDMEMKDTEKVQSENAGMKFVLEHKG